MGFGEQLKILRIKAHITQQEMADKLDMSRQNYCYYEKDKAKPKIESLCKIASLLNTTPNILLGIEQEQKEIDVQTVLEMQMQIIDTMIESLSDIRDVLKNAVQNNLH